MHFKAYSDPQGPLRLHELAAAVTRRVRCTTFKRTFMPSPACPARVGGAEQSGT